MTTLTYTVPVAGVDLNSVADPEVATALASIKNWANGNVDATNLAPLTAAVWIAPTLINSWATAGGGTELPGYFKDPLGFVHVRGRYNTGVSSTVAFVLPLGYRPGGILTYPAARINGATPVPAVVAIDTLGNVAIWYAAGTTDIGFGISFLAEN